MKVLILASDRRGWRTMRFDLMEPKELRKISRKGARLSCFSTIPGAAQAAGRKRAAMANNPFRNPEVGRKGGKARQAKGGVY